ncbi:MAG: thioredoxin family protein [Chloroflexota bacterium]
MTYPDSAVASFVNNHLIAVRLILGRREDQPHFRTHRVIWTPTIVFLDRRGTSHYQSPGYLPPDEFLPMLQIGLARSLMAWGRYDEAADHLSSAVDTQTSALVPEALYWLGVARYLKVRWRSPMMEAWNRLRTEYPNNIWAVRVPPNQEDEPEDIR